MLFSQIFNYFSEAGEPALIWVVAFIWPLIVLSIPFCVIYDLVKKLKKHKERSLLKNDPNKNYKSLLDDGIDYR